MSLTTKQHLALAIQTLKNVIERVDSRFLSEEDAIKLVTKTGLISSPPLTAEDGSIYTDENGDIYIL